MPIHTKILWGENGILRKVKFAPETRQKELQIRVKMLQLHQKIAMGSLGAFFYQSYLGKQMVDGNYKYYDLQTNSDYQFYDALFVPNKSINLHNLMIVFHNYLLMSLQVLCCIVQ